MALVEAIESRLLLSVSLVKDILPGPGSSLPMNAVVAGNQMYFDAIESPGNGLPNYGLFRTDGTPAGTVEVMKTGPEWARDLTNDNGTVYFVLADSAAPFHTRLWKTDGTASGTVAVDDFGLQLNAVNTSLAVLGTTLYYQKDNEIWKTDPTQSAAELDLGGFASPPSFSGQFNGKLLVDADRLYIFDGTSLTALVPVAIFPGPAVLNATVYFLGNAGNCSQPALYRSDGTPGGTTVVTTLPVNAVEFGPVVTAGKLLFDVGNQVYASDGTAAGTTVIKSNLMLFPDATAFATLGNRGFFATTDPVTFHPQLWETDGTASGTTLVTDGIGVTDRPILDVYNGLLYFTAPPLPGGGGGGCGKPTAPRTARRPLAASLTPPAR